MLNAEKLAGHGGTAWSNQRVDMAKKPSDPVTQYATDVVQGRIVAGQLKPDELIELKRVEARKRTAKWRSAHLEQARENDRKARAKIRAANPEKALADAKAWRAANPDKLRAYYRADRVAHGEKRRAADRAYGAANREKKRAYAKAYNAAHRATARAKVKAWNAERVAMVLVRDRLWREANREHVRAEYKAWARANPGRLNAKTARRNAAVRRATPAWSDLRAIEAIYIEAARLTRTTGVPHDVDHFYPIQGKTVCGLHVADNLRVISKSENMRKKNKFPTEVAC